ncbi:hypothetical protein PRZ48_000783 [Zasmidium cellare]|uniref:F-box domain-containing protein n=1 Tax=Zasmidium cellare TaxID=395010 RepID=A0ABR0EZG3_ZASCE|nr:hypothetical protein PRZ48_000783 [Zasmidium cellare]
MTASKPTVNTSAPAKATMANSTSAPKKASLLGLPAELRVLIFEEIFPPHIIKNLFPQFLIHNRLHDISHRPPPKRRPPPKHISILLTSRQLHREALKVLYAHAQVDLTITPLLHPREDPIPIARIDGVRFLPHVRDLRLTIKLWKRCVGPGVVIEALARALDGGRGLRKLHVRIDWEDGVGWPGEGFVEAVEACVRGFEMGKVKGVVVLVEVAGEMDEEEKEVVEERLKDRMVMGKAERGEVELIKGVQGLGL